MSHKKAKRIRKEMRANGIAISAEPYSYNGIQMIASKGRRTYQRMKKERAKAITEWVGR